MKFSSFNLKPQLIEVLAKLGYVEPTKVQQVVIPKALKNENLIVKSETGSGKTHSFLIPIVNNVKFNGLLQAIIIVPSRELARQTYAFFNDIKRFEYFKNLNVKLFVSGEDSKKDLKSFENQCEVLIATPGKLSFLIENAKEGYFDNLKTLVLDEADMLIDSTFIDEIDSIISKFDNKLQIEVFSATISPKVNVFLRKYISPDYEITIDAKNNTNSKVEHYFINTKHRDRYELIIRFIKQINPYLLLIFASSKDRVHQIYEYLSSNGYKCGQISGDLEARERKSMLRRIKNDEFRIVVCSDLASRGIDVLNVSEILNFDLPNNLEYYYHRAGRTGRNQNTGKCYSFYDNDTTKVVSRLLKEGLSAKFIKFGDDEFVDDVFENTQIKRKKKTNEELEKEIKKAKSLTKSEKVKPGYKKKVKRAIDKVKQKHRREIIKNDIKRQRIERYKEANRRND